jgi:hypothetical protein
MTQREIVRPRPSFWVMIVGATLALLGAKVGSLLALPRSG